MKYSADSRCQITRGSLGWDPGADAGGALYGPVIAKTGLQPSAGAVLFCAEALLLVSGNRIYADRFEKLQKEAAVRAAEVTLKE